MLVILITAELHWLPINFFEFDTYQSLFKTEWQLLLYVIQTLVFIDVCLRTRTEQVSKTNRVILTSNVICCSSLFNRGSVQWSEVFYYRFVCHINCLLSRLR